MSTVTIFGNGNMGAAIDSVLSAGGASVDHITSSDVGKPITGELVILAVYHPALAQITSQYADQLAGKIVVDITNPVNMETFDGLVIPVGSSSAAELAAHCRHPAFSRRSTPTSPPPSSAGRSGRTRPPCWWPGTTRPRRRP
jgi:predicted dinucleotide-binding enzyme